jgi:alpha-L-fucosidase
MWESEQSWNWNSVDVGPKRDVIQDLRTAIQPYNITFGLYHSLYEWFNPLYLEDYNSGSPPKKQNYTDEILLPQLIDMVKKYKPEIVWADGDWDEDSSYWKSTEFLAWLYNDSPVQDTVIVVRTRYSLYLGTKTLFRMTDGDTNAEEQTVGSIQIMMDIIQGTKNVKTR